MQRRITKDELVAIRPRIKLLQRFDERELEVQAVIDRIVSIEDEEIAQILFWKYVDGLTWVQIGAKTHNPPDAIRMYVNRYLYGQKHA